MTLNAFLVTSTLFLLSAVANANDEEAKPFTMDGELGFTSTTGNTKSSSSLIKLNAKHELSDWSNPTLLKVFTRNKKR